MHLFLFLVLTHPLHPTLHPSDQLCASPQLITSFSTVPLHRLHPGLELFNPFFLGLESYFSSLQYFNSHSLPIFLAFSSLLSFMIFLKTFLFALQKECLQGSSRFSFLRMHFPLLFFSWRSTTLGEHEHKAGFSSQTGFPNSRKWQTPIHHNYSTWINLSWWWDILSLCSVGVYDLPLQQFQKLFKSKLHSPASDRMETIKLMSVLPGYSGVPTLWGNSVKTPVKKRS